jgi:hypothetical protein
MKTQRQTDWRNEKSEYMPKGLWCSRKKGTVSPTRVRAKKWTTFVRARGDTNKRSAISGLAKIMQQGQARGSRGDDKVPTCTYCISDFAYCFIIK